MDGIVRSYNPRTSFGEHQFFIYISSQDAAVVFLPIVPTRLGDISITVSAFTLIGKDTITKTLHVEVNIIFITLVITKLLSPISTANLTLKLVPFIELNGSK